MAHHARAFDREILLSFWKIHILHHASERPVYGQWIAQELREHGYDISPGTLYPLLDRMQRQGWLRSRQSDPGNPRSRRDYRLTAEGRSTLARVRRQVNELHQEVVGRSPGRGSSASPTRQRESQRTKPARSTRSSRGNRPAQRPR